MATATADRPTRGSNSTREFVVKVCTPANISLEEAAREAHKLAPSAERQGFKVGYEEILAKLGDSDRILNYIAPDGDLAAFGSLLKPVVISIEGDSEIVLVYANGVLVNPAYGKLGLCTEFLHTAGRGADIVVGHTQNPAILATFRNVYPRVWPSEPSEGRTRLAPEFGEALAKYLETIGRPQHFDRETGLVRDLYPRPLHAHESGDRDADSKVLNTGGDGTLVIGFNNEQLYTKAVEPVLDFHISPALAADRHTEAKATSYLDSLDSVIIGWGHAGRDLHSSCLRKAAERDPKHVVSGRVGLVERNSLVETPPWLTCSRTLAEARANFDPATTVLQVTTGPADRVAVVRDAAELGYRFFILEKPLTADRPDLDELLRVVEADKLKVVVNFPWLDTPLTRKLKEIIDSGEHGELLKLKMIQSKPRGYREVDASGHNTAFEVEIPHEVSLALYLVGTQASVRDAGYKHLVEANRIIPAMGGADIHISHGRAVSDLRSDLESLEPRRTIELIFEDGWRCCGWYPPSGADGRQVLRQYWRSGLWDGKDEQFFDDPLTSLFIESYHYFLGIGPQPVSTLDLAVRTANLISEAKRACGLEVEPFSEMTRQGGDR